jgi:hypothetical protein
MLASSSGLNRFSTVDANRRVGNRTMRKIIQIIMATSKFSFYILNDSGREKKTPLSMGEFRTGHMDRFVLLAIQSTPRGKASKRGHFISWVATRQGGVVR